ncbi:MAG: succinylglutamate desuccinylase/aspartoacylase family protein [Nitriliruptoraceae bacterium]
MNEPVTVAGVQIEPGERRDLAPAVTQSFTGDLTSLPMTVMNGADDGPRAFVTAAIHGDELNGIAVCGRLLTTLDPATLHGTVIIVPIVNVPGAQIASRYLPDRRDLNRSFPGTHNGSMAARLARLLLDEVVVGSDVGIDLHTAANHRTNAPQVRIDTEDTELLRLAVAFGAPFVLDARLRPGSLRATAAERGVQVLTFEGGGPLRFDDEAIDIAERGVRRVLHRLDVIDEAPPPAHEHPMVLHESRWLRAERGGILEVHVGIGDEVHVGQPLWSTTSPLGAERLTIDADEDGHVIGATTLPLVQPGHAVLHIALPGDRQPSEDDPTDEEDDEPDAFDGN